MTAEDPTAWFDEARFGMFVHWSHCSQLGCEISWPMVGGGGIPGLSTREVDVDEYHAGADTFCPRPGAARD